ncbi:Rqc2 family fibronectin-binding protein [Cellulosilyticum sp. I15G10I2]|uniref:Rqc2 family fibronectin-binding protein n=1 Tax=Cellulosilyticum sp. I15G10I2 TaxID=1892843 RepID=UPI00085C6462|nr:NFACT RNA binding domain-containing protein [Cellulosilyticum sp. I15G10I2]
MALDGIVLANIVHELDTLLVNGRIDKIYQIEKEDILLSIRNNSTSYKLLLTANSNYPRLHLSTLAKNPSLEPPMFCMMLRKHLSGGRILKIEQPHFERIVKLHIEATNELGDKEVKYLIIEIMGRHSNIMLVRPDGILLDSIKHISADKSSVRQVLPNKLYSYPPQQGKLNPLETTKDCFIECIRSKNMPLFKCIYLSYSGLSPLIANEICLSAKVDAELIGNTADENTCLNLYEAFDKVISRVRTNSFDPSLFLNTEELPIDFYSMILDLYSLYTLKHFSSVSELVEGYYYEKNSRFNIAQKTTDIKKLLHTFIDRAVRKKHIQQKALADSQNKDLYKIYGELLTAYSHQVPPQSKSFVTTNYYEEPYDEITIPLDEKLNAIQNAQYYFKLYSKAKRTEIAAAQQLDQIEEDLKYLDSVLLSLDLLETKEDIAQLRAELVAMGYLKKRKGISKKQASKKTLPYLHFKSASGHDIYVGKNNYQNDELTMKFAKATDLWLHIKDGPGSHVIVKLEHNTAVDDLTLEQAASLAAFYSSGRLSSHVPIDYTLRKNVKKIPNAKPGMVIYNHFKTIYVTPVESEVKRLMV